MTILNGCLKHCTGAAYKTLMRLQSQHARALLRTFYGGARHAGVDTIDDDRDDDDDEWHACVRRESRSRIALGSNVSSVSRPCKRLEPSEPSHSDVDVGASTHVTIKHINIEHRVAVSWGEANRRAQMARDIVAPLLIHKSP